MALATLQEAKDFQQITTTDTDDTVQLLLDLASNWIETECGRKFTSDTYTEYYSGDGSPDLRLRQRPVTAITSIHVDANGFFGDASGAFAASTLLTVGENYALIRDEPSETWSKSGIVRWRGTQDDGWGWQSFNWSGFLTRGLRRSGWPIGEGNIKVVYVAGWTVIPSDLKLACLQFVQTLQSQTDNNRFQPTSEGLGPYNYSAAQLTYFAREVTGMIKTITRYREIAI